MDIEFVPASQSSINGELVYTFYDIKATDEVTYPDYKYVINIYITDIGLVATQKAQPHPTDQRGVFDIAPAIRNYIEFNFAPVPDNFVAQRIRQIEWYHNIQVKIGEEYDGTLYADIVDTGEKRFYNYYNQRGVLNRPAQLALYYNKFATNRPARNNIVNFYSTLLFITYYNFDNEDINSIVINVDGTDLIEFDLVFNVDALHILNISPGCINALYPDTITSDTKYYSISINGQDAYRFDLYCEPIYTPHTVHFMNKFGGIETFDFIKKSVSKLTMSSKSIGLSRSDNNGDTVTGIVVNPNFKTYATTYSEKLTLNSNNIKEGQYRWLSELILSPMKFLEQDGVLVPVKITNTDYEFKTSVNDRAASYLTIEIDFNDNINTQFR